MVKFGSFDAICRGVSLPLCPLLGPPNSGGITADCYSRNVNLGGFLLFQSGRQAMV